MSNWQISATIGGSTQTQSITAATTKEAAKRNIRTAVRALANKFNVAGYTVSANAEKLIIKIDQ